MSFIRLPKMYALIDCNNFYASCERLFRPDLFNKAIIILSNNDGCVVARSNEAKALGIKMGVPYFEIKALCKQNKVHTFSSNYTLYADLSARVMRIIEESWPSVEIYSIDEAFLDLSTLPTLHLEEFCKDLQAKILRHTGIPTSIGVGKTKTLAKIANHIAKKKLNLPVFILKSIDNFWLQHIAIDEVWGIGRQWSKKLTAIGILTAADLANFNFSFVKKQFSVVLQRTAMELAGIPCLDLEVFEPKKSIISSCSFGKLQTDYKLIEEALSHHCATAWAKMRKQGLIAEHLSIFLRSNSFRKDLPQYAKTIGFRLINPTDDLRRLTNSAKFCLKKIFKPGIFYNKSGVLLSELIDRNYRQQDLFSPLREKDIDEADKLMALIDAINKKYGARIIRLAAEGFQKSWSMKRELKTPNYTTRWTDLPIAHATSIIPSAAEGTSESWELSQPHQT